jgi:hypothetical protein
LWEGLVVIAILGCLRVVVPEVEDILAVGWWRFEC